MKKEELASVPCEAGGNVFSAPSLDDLLSGRSIWSKWPKTQQLNLGLWQSGEVDRDTGSSREWVHGCQASVMERFPSEGPVCGRFSLSMSAHIYTGEENVSVWFLDKKGHKRFVSASGKEHALPKMLIPLQRCHSQILWYAVLRELVLQLHTFPCEGFWEAGFSLYNLQHITWALKKPSTFETDLCCLLNQAETSQWTQKTLRMDI